MALEIGLLRIPKLFLKHMGVTIMVGVVEKVDFCAIYLPLELGHFEGTNTNVIIFALVSPTMCPPSELRSSLVF